MTEKLIKITPESVKPAEKALLEFGKAAERAGDIIRRSFGVPRERLFPPTTPKTDDLLEMFSHRTFYPTDEDRLITLAGDAGWNLLESNLEWCNGSEFINVYLESDGSLAALAKRDGDLCVARIPKERVSEFLERVRRGRTTRQQTEVTMPKMTERVPEIPDVQRVFNAWRERRSNPARCRLSPPREKLIKSRLKQGYTADDLILVIRWANEADDNDARWLRGENPRRTEYLGLDNLYRLKRIDDRIEKAHEWDDDRDPGDDGGGLDLGPLRHLYTDKPEGT